MNKDKFDSAVVAAAAPAVAEPLPPCVLYLARPWTTGDGTTHPAYVEGGKPLTLDFAALPKGVVANDIDYLISTGSAESEAMRSARLKVTRAAS